MSDGSVWHVRLVGPAIDIDHLAELFEIGKVRVEKLDDEFVLYADAFSSMSEAADVQVEGNRLLRVLNGCAHAKYMNHQPISSGAIVCVHPDGRRSSNVFVSAAASISFSGTAKVDVLDSLGNVKPPCPPRERSWAEAALTDRQVEKILGYMGEPNQDFFTLYKIYEVIKEDTGSRADTLNWVTSTGITTQSELNRFLDSANDSALSGDAARHATAANPPHPGPAMSILESKKLVFRIASAWLNERIP